MKRCFSKFLYLPVIVFSGIWLMTYSLWPIACFSVHAEQLKDDSSLEKNKQEILRDIDLFEHSVYETKSCVSKARTAEELKQCRIEETRIKFQRIQDDLSEIGMTPEERRMYELRPGR